MVLKILSGGTNLLVSEELFFKELLESIDFVLDLRRVQDQARLSVPCRFLLILQQANRATSHNLSMLYTGIHWHKLLRLGMVSARFPKDTSRKHL